LFNHLDVVLTSLKALGQGLVPALHKIAPTFLGVQEEVIARSVPLPVTIAATAGYMLCVLYLLMTQNPRNYYSARRVFQAPLLTQAECQRIIDMSMAAAERNYELAVNPQATVTATSASANATRRDFQQEPLGWHKSCHGSYPTTDLNLVTDPFSRSDLEWISNILHRRLAPTLSRIYGVPDDWESRIYFGKRYILFKYFRSLLLFLFTVVCIYSIVLLGQINNQQDNGNTLIRVLSYILFIQERACTPKENR
jgi:hypothetical protein